MVEIVVLLIASILGTVIGTVLALEAWASVPHLGSSLVRNTIDRFPASVPEAERVRWAEELKADFATYEDRRLAGLVFAIRLRATGGRKLMAELAAARPSGKRTAAPATKAVPAQIEQLEGLVLRRAIERRLGEMSIPFLAGLAKSQAGMSLEQLAPQRSDQHHRAWREAVQGRLAVILEERCRALDEGEDEAR